MLYMAKRKKRRNESTLIKFLSNIRERLLMELLRHWPCHLTKNFYTEQDVAQ